MGISAVEWHYLKGTYQYKFGQLACQRSDEYTWSLPVQNQLCVKFLFWKRVNAKHQTGRDTICGRVDNPHPEKFSQSTRIWSYINKVGIHFCMSQNVSSESKTDFFNLLWRSQVHFRHSLSYNYTCHPQSPKCKLDSFNYLREGWWGREDIEMMKYLYLNTNMVIELLQCSSHFCCHGHHTGHHGNHVINNNIPSSVVPLRGPQ